MHDWRGWFHDPRLLLIGGVLLGIGLGGSLALIPASQIITDMAVEIPGLTFQVPWKEIVVVSGLAYAMTLLTTWLPAVQASRVRPAEALRYK